jgi:polysaccharide export outer membrane protein
MLPRTLAVLVTALLLAAPVCAQNDAPYELRPGDKVTAEVFTAAGEQVSVVSGERILDRDGNVYLPYIGTVHLAGLDQVAARDSLVARYSHFYDQPVVNLTVKLRVNVTGVVGRPGQYYLDPTATIIDALSNAGGIGSDVSVASIQVASDPEHVRLVRDGQTLILNLRADEISDSVINMRIRSGDWIHVPPQPSSRIRSELTFWGSILSFTSSIVALIVYISR